MSTKKERKARQIRARKKKQQRRIGIVGVISAVCIGFLIFFFITLFDSLFPPTNNRTTRIETEQKVKMTLFFADTNERFLVPELRYIAQKTDTASQAEELIRALIGGPSMGSVRTIPAEAKLLGISIKDKTTAVVNFDRNLIDFHPGGSASEMMTIYSITNTIIKNIPSIKGVTIWVEGKNPKTLKGHIDTESPFTLNEELIIREGS